MDSFEEFRFKHGSLIGGGRKGFMCLSLRLANILQALANLFFGIGYLFTFFLFPWSKLLNIFNGASIILEFDPKLSFVDYINFKIATLLYSLNNIQTGNYISEIETLVRDKMVIILASCLVMFSFAAFLFTFFGVLTRSQHLLRLSIFSSLGICIVQFIGLFYFPNLSSKLGFEPFKTEVLLVLSILLLIYFAWSIHLLYSLYKVIRAGGTGGEYLSYREIIDKRNFLRWRSWKERELERGVVYGRNVSTAAEHDRFPLLKK
ncbi:hypothetical protein ACR3K2_24250 [Cryptosporidium serpentis]